MRVRPVRVLSFLEFTICLQIDTLIQQDLRKYIDVRNSVSGTRLGVNFGSMMFDHPRQILVR